MRCRFTRTISALILGYVTILLCMSLDDWYHGDEERRADSIAVIRAGDIEELRQSAWNHSPALSGQASEGYHRVPSYPAPRSVLTCRGQDCLPSNTKSSNLPHLSNIMLFEEPRATLGANIIPSQRLPLKPCNKACQIRRKYEERRQKNKYNNRVSVESVTLPSNWTVSPELEQRLLQRKLHVKEVCQKYGLDEPSEINIPNAWEFLVNEQYGIAWCNVFKAASSTWLFNFNLLAGYTEKQLLSTKETPISLARKKYNRLKTEELERILNSPNPPLTFLIARHPLYRLVSAYRDKILSGTKYYRGLCIRIARKYKHLATPTRSSGVAEKEEASSGFIRNMLKKMFAKTPTPSFSQFVQYVLDSADEGKQLDEHWAPVYNFCTPCLVNFDVIAKVETLNEDGNYVIFKTGIDKLVKPKRINTAANGSSDKVAEEFLCQLSPNQMSDLLNLYKIDMELFEYDHKHLNCTVFKHQNSLR